MSLISASRETAELFTMSRYSRCSRASSVLERQFGHADDAVHGGADFMAHVGQEFALGAVGGFGGFLGRGQFGHQAAQRFRVLALGFARP